MAHPLLSSLDWAVQPSPKNFEAVLSAPEVRGKKVWTMGKGGHVMDVVRSIIINERPELKDQPFYVLDLGRVVALMEQWTRGLPDVKPFYPVKCNPNPIFLSALASLGAGFDCASKAEIETVLGLGVSPDRIIFANPCKSDAQIKYAASVGVNLTTFDSKGEIDKIKRWHPKCHVILRIKGVEDGAAMIKLGSKFGALTEEIVTLLQAAHQAGLAVDGVSFHIGSKIQNLHTYRRAIAEARQAFDTEASLGMLLDMHMLNIGGGMSSHHFDEIAPIINEAIHDYFQDKEGLTVMAEPGRFFAETTFTLATNIITKRVRGKVRQYWINDGVYGSMSLLHHGPKSLKPVPLSWARNRAYLRCPDGPTYESTVFGPSCDSQDTLLTGFELPELQIGDWLVFHNMGAYSAAVGCNFNGFSISDAPYYLACPN